MNQRLAFVASRVEEAQAACRALQSEHGECAPAAADVIVALGGDGFMLQTLHKFRDTGKPVFGMKLGSIGFLMNVWRPEALQERIERAEKSLLRPLEMSVLAESGASVEAIAFNEVSLLRQTKQAAHIRIILNGAEKLAELICDGMLVSTPAGSTAYNLSAFGPILPLDCRLLAMTPISPFRPRRWRGAILPSNIEMRMEILDHYKRPVSATADANEVRDIIEVTVRESTTRTVTLLFDPEHKLEDRILNEQFAH
ncbi:MAG: NAD kinase [Lysobacterales bacterium CG02_land_8_20_14_3_00_62_12]|nr:MAG: NAD kinase [Xanthomonadales bacterium CG02_land_8_20_14_3_00_62_12]